jgi:hypothetical protein
MAPTRRVSAGFRKFSKKKIHASRARRARTGLTVYPPWIQIRDVAPFVLGGIIENQNSDFVSP